MIGTMHATSAGAPGAGNGIRTIPEWSGGTAAEKDDMHTILAPSAGAPGSSDGVRTMHATSGGTAEGGDVIHAIQHHPQEASR